MRVIDWFAGIGCARLAFTRAGWDCVWSCERDADARRVYAHHFGSPPDAADILDVATGDIPAAECWVAGFPCQDLSIAGPRAGFDGTRSILVFRLLQLACLVRPPWLLLENVPGLLSVRGGADFGALLVALEDSGYVGAWRVLDARWFGVPQRRRRVFLLARHLGAPGPDPAPVLLESPRVRGSAPPCRPAGEDVARPLGRGPAGGLRTTDLDHGTYVVTALTAKMAKGSTGPSGDEHHHLIAQPVTAREYKGPDSSCTNGTLVADPVSAHEGKTYTHEGTNNFRLRNCVAESGVRRLLPLECERLQGLPDDWTAGRADTIRYRLIGNGMAVPVVTWLATQLREALS